MKGLSRDDGRLYAIKTIKSDDVTRNLSREIAVLQRLNHANVCYMKEAIHEDDGSISKCNTALSTQLDLNFVTAGIVLELVPGGDLCDYIDRLGVLSEVYLMPSRSFESLFLLIQLREGPVPLFSRSVVR